MLKASYPRTESDFDARLLVLRRLHYSCVEPFLLAGIFQARSPAINMTR
jgi:hypothetical protein